MPILWGALERRDGGYRSTFLPQLESAWRNLGPSSKPFGAENYGADIDSLSLRSVTRAVTIKKPPTMIAVTAAACVFSNRVMLRSGIPHGTRHDKD